MQRKKFVTVGFKGKVFMLLLSTQADFLQPSGLKTRLVEAGCSESSATGRMGRRTNSPPQFGQIPSNIVSTHRWQKVHSNEQIMASFESGRRSRLQHSQFGRNSSI
jgi:hypothetical protein